MKLFAPAYYKKFSCIADKCTHSCCVGWEIEVDEQTKTKYDTLRGDYADSVRKSIQDGDAACFKLRPDGRCPHLDEKGLCKIITEYGKDMLCDICREHPRFYNLTANGAEVGTGACCEAAAEIILSSDEYDKTIEIGEISDGFFRKTDAPCKENLVLRGKIFEILKSTPLPYPDKLEKIYRLADISKKSLAADIWREVIENLEYLSPDSKKRFLSYSESTEPTAEASKVLSRFLAYLVFRHTGECSSPAELRLALGFAVFCERLLASLIENEKGEPAAQLARLVSEEIEYSEDNTEAIKTEFSFLP